MKPTTIEEIKQKKSDLEKSILQLLQVFEGENEVQVSYLNLLKMETVHSQRVANITITLEI